MWQAGRTLRGGAAVVVLSDTGVSRLDKGCKAVASETEPSSHWRTTISLMIAGIILAPVLLPVVMNEQSLNNS